VAKLLRLRPYVPKNRIAPAHLSELKAAADRLAEALADVNEDEIAADFKQMRRRARMPSAEMIVFGRQTF